MQVFLLIVILIIVVLIVKLSNAKNENLKLLSEKCRYETYERYKRKNTKYLLNELQEISEEYYKRLNYYIKNFQEQYGSECYTPFGLDKEKVIDGGKSFMRNDKNDMSLYYQYNVICEILDRRNK